jgi:hypothetical protein
MVMPMGAGRPLAPEVREYFEPRFGYDFSGVRIHTGPTATSAARQLHARAFTTEGFNIAFDSGEFAPDTTRGRRLLAHELTHVVQQCRATEPPSDRGSPTIPRAQLRGLSARAINPTVQRYDHEDCTEEDVKSHVWPPDGLAKKMTSKALLALSQDPIKDEVRELLYKYFATRRPRVASIALAFQKVKREFSRDEYVYQCEYDDSDCDGDTLAWTWVELPWTDIHLCMNTFPDVSREIQAATMIHEMVHKKTGWDDIAQCTYGADFECLSCPADLGYPESLENPSSYGCFAKDVYSLDI